MGQKVMHYFEERLKEKENIISEREKLKKKAGKKANELEAKWGPINEEQFSFLSADLLVGCISERLKDPFLGAGMMLEGLASKYY